MITRKLEECCGCSACANICAQTAIAMQPDAMGFKYPVVDLKRCTDCGLCESVCSFSVHYDRSQNIDPTYYAAYLKDKDLLSQSQSGGAFVAFAKLILSHGGVIYGVGFDEHFTVKHMRATTWDECKKFRGSKYVQSDLDNVFELVKRDLRDGYFVLFSGTPCQIAGLKAYVGHNLSKTLYTLDLVCHGVSAPKVWDDYRVYIEKRKNDKLVEVRFRDKENFGWGSARASYRFSRHPLTVVTFPGSFNREVLFRPSCSDCKFTNTTRVGDITIGDFWSNRVIKGYNDTENGCSLIIVNSTKGKHLFESVDSYLNYIMVSQDDAMQYHLMHPVERDIHADEFANEYQKSGFYVAMRKYHDLGWKKQLRLRLGNIKRQILTIIRK